MIEFFITMNPSTVADKEYKISIRNGKSSLCNSPELEDAKSKLKGYLIRYRPEYSLTCGIRLTVKWLFPRGRHSNGEYRITEPGTNNLQKLLKDCMTECGFWRNDALICSEICEKFWSELPGIYVKIEEVA